MDATIEVEAKRGSGGLFDGGELAWRGAREDLYIKRVEAE
jgi:hypothetical protein